MCHILSQTKFNIRARHLSQSLLVACGIVCCHGCGIKVDNENRATLPEAFAHERRATLVTDAWGGMRVDWTAVADWPTGNSSVAKAVQVWIGKRLRNYRKEQFDGDTSDWDAMTRFYGKQFLADNGSKDIEKEWRTATDEPLAGEPDVKPGADVFIENESRWFCRHSAIIEYEDELIVSYRAGFYGYFVRNVTSAAYVKCATFRKTDGKMLGWDAFADTNAVFELVRELAKVEFKDGADYAGVGVVPVPSAPLFAKDGFWLFWGDYAIVHGHAYEMNGTFPLLFVPWGDPSCGGRLSGNREAVENMLTHESKANLGLVK